MTCRFPRSLFCPYVYGLHVPTLILTSSADIAENQAVAGTLAMAIPGSAPVVVADTGHMTYLEKPAALFFVSQFLKLHGL